MGFNRIWALKNENVFISKKVFFSQKFTIYRAVVEQEGPFCILYYDKQGQSLSIMELE